MITFDLNGREVASAANPESPLLWILRDDFQQLDVKYGCGRGLCGACTVQVNGTATRACSTPLGAVRGATVTTIAGLAAQQPTHPLFRAWTELDVAQCGYCQLGQLLQAAALLRTSTHPTDAEIDAAMAGNICRCGTYERIRAAIHRAAELGGSSR